MTQNNVTFQRPDHQDALKDWRFVNLICKGERALIDGDFLPKINPDDHSKRALERHRQYKQRAAFYNVTRRTLQGLIGSVFRKDPELTIPTALAFASTDMDGRGLSIYQQSQSVLSAVLKNGRACLLVDYPKTDGVQTVAQLQELAIRPSVIEINPAQVINWRTSRFGGVMKLSLVVISESVEMVTEDGFGTKSTQQYRALRLIDGIYTVQIWQKTNESWEVVEQFTPLNASGQPWLDIPFIFVGATNNDPVIDDAPLLDIARLNAHHYYNSADYEDSVWWMSQPQYWASGIDEHWVEFLRKEHIAIGSRDLFPVPTGEQLGLIQAQANGMAFEAMTHKEKQMAALGARLVQKGEAIKTATEAQGDNEVQHSVLSLAAANVSEAYTQCLAWMGQFAGTTEAAEYRLNQEFTEFNLDPQKLTALMQVWQSGGMPDSDFYANLKKASLIDPEKTDEDIKDELETRNQGLDLDGNIASTA